MYVCIYFCISYVSFNELYVLSCDNANSNVFITNGNKLKLN